MKEISLLAFMLLFLPLFVSAEDVDVEEEYTTQEEVDTTLIESDQQVLAQEKEELQILERQMEQLRKKIEERRERIWQKFGLNLRSTLEREDEDGDFENEEMERPEMPELYNRKMRSEVLEKRSDMAEQKAELFEERSTEATEIGKERKANFFQKAADRFERRSGNLDNRAVKVKERAEQWKLSFPSSSMLEQSLLRPLSDDEQEAREKQATAQKKLFKFRNLLYRRGGLGHNDTQN